MSSDEIIAQLRRPPHHLPVEALRAAEGHRAALTPRLLACLAEVVEDPGILDQNADDQLPFFAMYLLAAWRETAAHPLLLGFLRLPGDQCLDLSGDIVTEDANRLLAQTSGGDLQGILSLVRDENVNEWSRVAGISALALLTAWGELPRDALVRHYRELIAAIGPPRLASDPGPVLAQFLSCALDLRLVELRDELLVLMERGWIDETIVGRSADVAAEFERPTPHPLDAPITDVAQAIRWWQGFSQERSGKSGTSRPIASLPPRPIGGADFLPPPHRAPPKVGRNDPCPCGSGKKFKKCCGG